MSSSRTLPKPFWNLFVAATAILAQSAYGQYEFAKRFTVQISNKTYAVQGKTVYLEKADGRDSILATFPQLTDSLYLYYWKRVPSQVGFDTSEGSDYPPNMDSTEVGAVTTYNGTIWVGFRFYEGEGSDGIGGVGFYDPGTNETGVLRHPGLIGYSTAELLVTKDTIYAKTIGEYELSTSYGNGVVAISRKTLGAVARVPLGNEMLMDNDPTNGPAGNPRYERPLSNLVSDAEFIPRKIPDWWKEAKEEILHFGPRQFMIHCATFENEFK